MPNDGGVSKKVAGAKKALDNVYESNVSGRRPAEESKSAAAAPDKKKSAGGGILEGLKKMSQEADAEGKSTADGLKSKQNNVDSYKKAVEGDGAVPKMHKGGKVKKDGLHDLKKGEVVLTEKDAKKKGVVDGLKADGEEKSEKKDSAKEDKKEASKKKHKFHRTEIEHHSDGSHTVRHHPHPSMKVEGAEQEQPVSYAAPDMATLHAGMDQNLGAAPDQGAAQ